MCFQGTPTQQRTLAGDAMFISNTTFTLDASGCAQNVAANGSAFTAHGTAFNSMVADPNNTTTVAFGLAGAGSRTVGLDITIDALDVGRGYGVDTQCSKPPTAKWDRRSIVAHELGEAWSQYLKMSPNPTVVANAAMEWVSWENSIHAQAGRPNRHPTTHRC